MDTQHLNRVKFLVRPDAWAAWELLNPSSDVLDMALSEYGDLRLVAAYVLEAVCADARGKAVETVAQTKKIKVGPIELEKATNTANKLTVSADNWCSRATCLRDQVDAEMRSRNGSRTICLPVEVKF